MIIYFLTITYLKQIYSFIGDGNQAGLMINIAYNDLIFGSSSNTNDILTKTHSIINDYEFEINVWFHFALIKQANSGFVYINGVLLNVF